MRKQIYSQDPRSLPTYGVAEAARYLSIRPSTLRDWVVGRPSPAREGGHSSPPLIALSDPTTRLLSFTNLVEAYVLTAFRRRHRIQMQKVRDALLYLEKKLGSKHPLASERLETDGRSLFIKRYGQLINLSEDGQLAIEAVLKPYLQRIEHDASGLAIRFFPVRRTEDAESPRTVVIDPFLSFGKPVLAGTGIPTGIIFHRFDTGERSQSLRTTMA